MEETQQSSPSDEVKRATRVMVLIHAVLIIVILALILFIVPIFKEMYEGSG